MTQNNFIFNQTDIIENQPSNNIVFTFNPSQGNVCDGVRTESNNFDCQCKDIRTNNSDFVFNCGNTDSFGVIRFHHGESVSFRLYQPLSQFYVNHGEHVSLNLTTYESYRMIQRYYHGEDVSFSIYRTPQFNVNVNHGEQSSFVLTVPTTARFDVDINHGEETSLDLSTQQSINFDVYHGEECNVVIERIEPVYLDFQHYHGEDVSHTLSTTSLLRLTCYHGEEVSLDPSTQQSISFDVYHGEDVLVNLTTYQPVYLDFQHYHGEEVSLDLSTPQSISFDVYHGEESTLELMTYVATGMIFDVYHGEQSNFSLIETTRLKFDVIDGSSVDLNLDYREKYKPEISVYHGENVSLNQLTFDVNIGTFNIHHGECVEVPYLDTVPNNYIYHGESVDFDLSTDVILTPRFYNGEECNVIIDYAESEPLGTFRHYHGEHVGFDVVSQVSHNLRFHIGFNIDFTVNRWKSNYIDLNLKSCCPPSVNDVLYVDLSDEPDTDLKYDGEFKDKVSFDMSMVRLFEFNVYHGETFRAIDNTIDIEFNVYHGENTIAKTLHNDVFVDLTFGNVEYTDNVIIEMDRPIVNYRTTFSSYRYGENVEFDIAASYSNTFNVYHGQSVEFNLYIEEPFRFNIIHGESIDITTNATSSFVINSQYGDDVSVIFYEEPYKIGYGETLTLPELALSYEVEFLEEGCLLNTNIPVDSNGVPIIDDINEMSIEGRKYQHFVLGRCY